MRNFFVGAVTLLLAAPVVSQAYSIEIDKSSPTLTKAAQQALTLQGYAVPYADIGSGSLRTSPREMKLSSEEADCGSVLGLSYLKDKRTVTTVTVNVQVSGKTVTASTDIQGVMHTGAGAPDKPLSCLSKGAIEKRVVQGIQQIASQMVEEEAASAAAVAPDPAPAPAQAMEEATSAPAASKLIDYPRTPDEAVELFDTRINLDEVNYRNAVTLSFNYQNKTSKKIIGIATRIIVTNPFGKVVLNQKLEDEIAIDPGMMRASDGFWHWDDNPFIQGEPYDLMWQSVKNDTAQIKTQILKVVFADGTVLERKADPKQRK